MNGWREFWEFGFPIACMILIIGTFFGSFIAAIDYLDCRGFHSATGIAVQYNWGCYAQTPDGKWVPKKYIFGDAHELRNGEKERP